MNVIARMQTGLLTNPKDDTVEDEESTMLGKYFRWIAGSDHANNRYYERIYVNGRQEGMQNNLEHLVGFVK